MADEFSCSYGLPNVDPKSFLESTLLTNDRNAPEVLLQYYPFVFWERRGLGCRPFFARFEGDQGVHMEPSYRGEGSFHE